MIDELRGFLLVVELGTVTAAARKQHLSQPALTAALQRLEQQLGARLLHRGRRGVEPTAAGEALVPKARAVLAALEDARRAVSEVSGLRAGKVRIGAGATVCTYVLPRYLGTFREKYPGVKLEVREMHPREIREALDQGELDLAVIPGREGEKWFTDELVLVTAPTLTAAEGAVAPFVTFPQGSSTRGMVDGLFSEAEVAVELSGIAAVKSHTRAGFGRSLLSRFAVEQDLAAGRLVELADPRTPVYRPMTLVHAGREKLSPAAGALREMLRSEPPVPLPPVKRRARGVAGTAARKRAGV